MAVVTSGGVATGVAQLEFLGPDPETTVATLIVGGLGVALLAVGVYGLVSGLRNVRHWWTLSKASPLARSSFAGDLVHVEGTVDGPADGHSLSSRYEGSPCVAYACEILDEQSANRENIYESAGGVLRDRSRTAEDAIPFVVRADGQQVQIEASDANLVWSGVDFDSVSAGSVARNAGTLRRLWVIFRSLTRQSHRRRRYYEARLQPGDEVAVVGTVSRRGDDVTLEPARGAPLVVSTSSGHSIPSGYRSRAFGGFVGAVLFGGAGAVLLYFLAGAL